MSLKVTYPRGSYSPSHYPRGGADFYSTPSLMEWEGERKKRDVDKGMLRGANNVTLEYSVYFPSDFDFVKGGKLPGLYGGHEK